jgi:hypothetical protein
MAHWDEIALLKLTHLSHNCFPLGTNAQVDTARRAIAKKADESSDGVFDYWWPPMGDCNPIKVTKHGGRIVNLSF